MYSSLQKQVAIIDNLLPIFELDSSLKQDKLKFIINNEIWEVENLLTETQCNKLIEFTESKGYEQALLNTGEIGCKLKFIHLY